MTNRPPDLDIDLTGAAHPSRSARKEMRRFLATRAIGLVGDAGVATTEVVRLAARSHSGRLQMRAWFDPQETKLRVEVIDADGNLASAGFPIVAALSTSWGTVPDEDGAIVWFEMHPREVHQSRGGLSG
jgi:hypothetical protein